MSDIAELFARDPLNLSRADIDAIITYYRSARANFILGEKQAGSTKKLKAASEPKPKMTALDLDDLMNGEL